MSVIGSKTGVARHQRWKSRLRPAYIKKSAKIRALFGIYPDIILIFDMNSKIEQMAFDRKYQNYGVIKIEGGTVRLYESQQNFLTLNTSGGTPVSAFWAGDCVVVGMADGKARRYSMQQTFQIV